jgi:hypothetical protein
MKVFNLISMIPALWFLGCLSLFGLVALHLGEIPVYSKSPDPSSLQITGWTAGVLGMELLSMASIPVWLFSLIHSFKTKNTDSSFGFFAGLYLVFFVLLICFHSSSVLKPYSDWLYD